MMATIDSILAVAFFGLWMYGVFTGAFDAERRIMLFILMQIFI